MVNEKVFIQKEPNSTAPIEAIVQAKGSVPEDGSYLPLMEAFYTIQGEGYHTGKAAYFIRLGGCDVGCHWCDVKESWDASIHPLSSVASIVSNALLFPAKAVVVTGGEPLLYNLDLLCSMLQENNVKTFLETSGAYPLSGNWDWVCLSPKKFKAPLVDVCKKANELKVIIFNKSDFKWAEKYAALVTPECRLYMQPEWSKAQDLIPDIVDYVKANPNWEISLQTHKFMHIP